MSIQLKCHTVNVKVQFTHRGFRYLKKNDKPLFYKKVVERPSFSPVFYSSWKTNLLDQLSVSVLLFHHQVAETYWHRIQSD